MNAFITFSRAMGFFSCLVLLSFAALGQGKIAGKVVDKNTGEAIIGANVSVKDANTGAASDLDGNYFISVPEGTYTLVFEYLGYKTEEFKDVIVKNSQTTHIDAAMGEGAEELQEVVIQGELKRETVDAILIQQKNAVSNASGISAEQFRKLPDRTTSDIMRRVSGASIQENKFAIIRGLSDRYNMAMLNGVPMPSTESDRKAFSFDLIPASLLDNMIINKTATPDQQGDFAGGIIQINTKDIPTENIQTIGISSGTYSLSTFKPTYKVEGSNTDFLGIDNGQRKVPDNFGVLDPNSKLTQNQQLAQQSKLWTHNFAPRKVNSTSPNLAIQYTLGRRMDILKNPFGVLFAINYNTNSRYLPYASDNVVSPGGGNSDGTYYQNDLYRTQVLLGGILNFAYRIGQNTKLSFKNLYNINSENNTNIRTGDFIDGGTVNHSKEYIYQFSSNRLYSSQLAFDHHFQNNIKIKIIGGLNVINRQVPDYRKLKYIGISQDSSGNWNSYRADISNSGGNFVSNSGRYFSYLSERSENLTYDFTLPVTVLRSEIKIGGFNQIRTRSFRFNSYVYNINSSRSPAYLQQGPEAIFDTSHFNNTGLRLTPDVQNYYNATANLNSVYAMMDNKFTSKLRLIWGGRMEEYYQKVSSYSMGFVVGQFKKIALLPSATFIYSINNKQNIKAAYAKTVSRPEFREVSTLQFYDFNYNSVVDGDPNLTQGQIFNYDLKYEIYPNAGEILSVNAFFKSFTTPIELINVPGSGGIRTLTYQNQKSAVNYGFEVELRKKFFENFTVFGNYTYVHSRISLANRNTANNNRPLQGQSPYVVNGGVQYVSEKYMGNVSLNFNRIGRRIFFAGDLPSTTVWESPRTVVDFQIAKTFFKKLEVRYIIGDILHQNWTFYNDVDGNGKFNGNKDVVAFKYKMGFLNNVWITYKF